jgi:hypothetical protein
MSIYLFYVLLAGVSLLFIFVFLLIRYKLPEKYQGLKIAAGALIFSMIGAWMIALNFRRAGALVFVCGIPIFIWGGVVHIYNALGMRPKFRRRHRWEDDE